MIYHWCFCNQYANYTKNTIFQRMFNYGIDPSVTLFQKIVPAVHLHKEFLRH